MLEIVASEGGSDWCELQLSGEVSVATAHTLEDALARLLGPGRIVLVGLTNCRLLDSSGIAVLLTAGRVLESVGGRLALFAANGQPQRVLEVTGLDARGLLFADRESALSACRGDAPASEEQERAPPSVADEAGPA